MKASLLSVLLLAMLMGTSACSKKDADDATPSEPAEFGLSAEQVYARRCASCHGSGGKGDGPLSRNYPRVGDLSSAQVQDAHSDEGLQEIMQRGFRRMPPVRNLTTPELRLLVEQVRKLGGRTAAWQDEAQGDEATTE